MSVPMALTVGRQPGADHSPDQRRQRVAAADGEESDDEIVDRQRHGDERRADDDRPDDRQCHGEKGAKRARAQIARALDDPVVEIGHARMDDQDDEGLGEEHMADDDGDQAELQPEADEERKQRHGQHQRRQHHRQGQDAHCESGPPRRKATQARSPPWCRRSPRSPRRSAR